MYATKNRTTTKIGESSATVLAKTVRDGFEIITWELVYPRYIHSELLTHRVFSRNAASSRATPTKVLIEQVRSSPVFFDEVRENMRGMVGGELLNEDEVKKFREEWVAAANYAADCAERWVGEHNIAKQTVNRILEPFLPIRTICTATEHANFFNLRLAPDAQPEIRSLAEAMLASMEEAEAIESDVHMPYKEYFPEDANDNNHLATRCLAACARVSVMRAGDKHSTLAEDEEFVERLRKNGHMSPFEHLAVAIPGVHANFRNWMSWRYIYENGFKYGL